MLFMRTVGISGFCHSIDGRYINNIMHDHKQDNSPETKAAAGSKKETSPKDDLQEFERKCREMTTEQLTFEHRIFPRCLYASYPIQTSPDWPKWKIICKVLGEKMKAEPESVEKARAIMFPR
jgi:hypothetical protein